MNAIHFNSWRRTFLCVGLTCLLFPYLVNDTFSKEAEPLNPVANDRLPSQIDDRPVVPDVGCFWSFKLEGDDYKSQVDAVAPYGAFDVLTLTVRQYNSIVNNQELLETTKKAVQYARDKYGIGTLLDIDLRIARYDFEKERPDLAQERLLYQETSIQGDDKDVVLKFSSQNLTDHYTGNLPYYVRGGRVVKAWAYQVEESGEIKPDSIVDVTDLAVWNKEQHIVANNPGNEVDDATVNDLDVSFDRAKLSEKGDRVAVAVAFRYAYPDLFADETLELERKIYQSYQVVPASGVAKDEWGFPPSFNRVDSLDDYWYSERMRQAYAVAYPQNDLVDDLFLAFRPQVGRADARVEAVDRFRRLCADRVVQYEFQNYALTKETWGKDAFVGVHGTWYPWPNTLEMRKNGIMWWKAPRDVAQTDEYAPFCARNSLAKANDSLWVNMFYARQVAPYIWEHWTAAASGGRVHIHQIYPRDENSPTNERDPKLLPIIADGGVAKIRQKIRMLNLVSNSQIDSPVAVVFGRIGASNPLRKEYKAVGWDVCDRFSTKGYPADLIPVDEIRSVSVKGQKRWSIKDGYLQYGSQKYQTVVLYGENAAEQEDYASLRALGESEPNYKTNVVFLPATASPEEKDAFVEKTIAELKARKIVTQTPWVHDSYKFENDVETSARPARKTISRFIDGTILWIAAQDSDFGDPIVLDKERLALNGEKTTPEISAIANGVFAVRLDDDGALNAVVASELKAFQIGDWGVELSEEEIGNDPVDVAIWRDSNGAWRGVFQRNQNALPKSLERLTPNWKYLQRR